MSLFGHNDKVLREISRTDCEMSCALEPDFECLSFEYSFLNSRCYLSSVTKDSQPDADFGSHVSLDYYQKVCGQSPPSESSSAQAVETTTIPATESGGI